MKQIEKRTLLLGAAAICWGILFPEYLFTTDSYTAFVQETGDAGVTPDTDGTRYAGGVSDADGTWYAGGVSDADGTWYEGGTSDTDGADQNGAMTGTGGTGDAGGAAGASGAGQADGVEHEEASADAEDLYEAVRSGRVRYRFRIYEYLKHHFFSRIEKEENALLWRELCALRGDAGSERGIVYLWSTQGRTDMRRSAYLIRESAG
ncbi:MAG: hypothetical protein NC254_01650 [bacterium]|nr:hypothetical protein [bacterium]